MVTSLLYLLVRVRPAMMGFMTSVVAKVGGQCACDGTQKVERSQDQWEHDMNEKAIKNKLLDK